MSGVNYINQRGDEIPLPTKVVERGQTQQRPNTDATLSLEKRQDAKS